MAITKDGNVAFVKGAQINSLKVTRLVLGLLSVGKTQLPAHDARGVLELIRAKDRTISSDSAHVALVGSIVTAKKLTYKPRSTK